MCPNLDKRCFPVGSPHFRMESGSGAHIWVSQLSSSHFTSSPSVQFSEVTSCSLRSCPHSRNRDNWPNIQLNGLICMLPSTRWCAAPRVSVPLGASLRHKGEMVEEVSTSRARREDKTRKTKNNLISMIQKLQNL